MPGGEMGDEAVTGYVERETRRLAASIEDAVKKEKQSATPLTRVVAVHFPSALRQREGTAFSGPIEAFQPEGLRVRAPPRGGNRRGLHRRARGRALRAGFV